MTVVRWLNRILLPVAVVGVIVYAVVAWRIQSDWDAKVRDLEQRKAAEIETESKLKNGVLE
jgi:hypothetical protein